MYFIIFIVLTKTYKEQYNESLKVPVFRSESSFIRGRKNKYTNKTHIKKEKNIFN